ncbi:MAG: efflux RND transporter periplasmic adaptor subunit [Alphaproteobacteria bacterium]|nr:efflux RND transporter periplasmic adaptor subunit [Alphaproteobacteria bacterium]
MIRSTPLLIAMAIVVPVAGMAGCEGNTPGAGLEARPAPSVITQAVRSKDVSRVVEYVGRSEASQRVEVRARVNGVLLERPFQEGAPVKAGDLLFSIDPAQYDAELASAEANVARANASVIEASASLKRYQALLKRDVTSVAKFDEAKAKDATARAELAAMKAALQKAKLDLDYTKIAAPISGRSGRAKADVGNLIGPDTGTLVTILKLDPINVTFAIGEREYLNYTERKQSGDQSKMVPRIRLANDELYAHEGTFNLIDNEVDPATGTISIRVSFPNPERLLVPGQFVSVFLTSDQPVKQVVVPQASVQENQTGPFVLVVTAEDRVEARPIKTGQRIGADIVALSGLEAGETIIVEGIQKVRPGGKVNPTPAKLPAKKASAKSPDGASAKAKPEKGATQADKSSTSKSQ